MSVQEIKREIEKLPAEERRQLTAFLVTLNHQDAADYRSELARKIDDSNSENWITLEAFDQKFAS